MSNDAVTLLGNLTSGPQGICEGGFPSGIFQVQFGLAGSCPGAGTKPALVSAYGTPNINSPSSYVTLPGVGSSSTVTQANTLYMRTTVPFLVRLTFATPGGGSDTVSVVPVLGLLILEPRSDGYLKLIEAQGIGSIEYYASGNL